MKTLNLIEKAFLLKRTSLFSDINLDNLVAIADNLDSMALESQNILFKSGQTPLLMYIIAHGEIELSQPSLPSQILYPGDIFGELSLFSGRKHTQNAKALSDAHLIVLTKKDVSAVIEECPEVAMKLLESFAKRM
jgi:CRP/FNR family cyclic AMP-dependent transcriptional regulator